MNSWLKCTASALCLMSLLVAGRAEAQPVPIEIGTPVGSSVPTAVNDLGQVVGTSRVVSSSAFRGFVWSMTGGMVDLGQAVRPTAINNLGQAVGSFPTTCLSLPSRSNFLWTATNGFVDIGALSCPMANTEPTDVSDHGHVVGWGDLGADYFAFLWTSIGGLRSLGTGLGGSAASIASDVNNLGQVAGHAWTTLFRPFFPFPPGLCTDLSAGPRHAFLWTATTRMDLGTLGGPYSEAVAVNNRGEVAGCSAFSALPSFPDKHAFQWTPTTGMVDLGTLGGRGSWATAMNADGWVVGASNYSGDTSRTHAFLWTAADGMVDLGTLGGGGSTALDVNNHGQVVGNSTLAGSSDRRGFVWMKAQGMVELPPLPGYAASDAWFVNNRGQVVGVSCNHSDCRDFRDDVLIATMWNVPVDVEDDWTFCAPEGGVCAFTGTTEVRYGANGSYVYLTLTDGTACNNAVFGDPLYGTRKSCAITIPPAPTEWTFCADEDDLCPFAGTMEVRYGADGAYVYQTLANGTACTNAVFGDPIYGTVKACAIRVPPDPTEWTFCAAEGGECAFTGAREVRYGANDVYVYQTLLDGTACTNEVFGDPIYGVVKFCSLRTGSPSPPHP